MNMIPSTARRALVSATLFTAATGSLFAQSREDDIQLLREQIRQLDQKLRVLERKQELKDEETATAAKANAKVTVGDKGISLASGDGSTSLRFRAVVQVDSRNFFTHDGSPNNSTFLLRKLRPGLEGTVSKFVDFQFTPEFAGSSFTVLDASVTAKFSPAFQLKVGKFKTPLGLELLISDPWLPFAERSLATNLTPNRDIGVQAGGDLWGGLINYAVGVFNGVADGANSTNADYDNSRDFAARVFARPFSLDKDSFLQGLGFGIAGTSGHQETATGLTAGYRTDGQQTLFRYRATALANGDVWRVSPQAYFYSGPYGVLAEYVESVSNVRGTATGPKAELKNKAWNVSANYVITGEDASYTQGVTPKHPFSPGAGTWGAWEVVGRASNLDIDNATFPLYADAAGNVTEATSYGAGVNWYLTRALKASVDYFQTDFKLPADVSTNALLRQDEKVLITRLQVSF